MNTFANAANAAKNRGQHTISSIPKPPMIVYDNRVSAFFRSTTPNGQRIPTILAHDVGLQCAFVVSNKVKLMTAPSLVTDSTIGFSLTDDPIHHAPTTMRVGDAIQFVLAIVPRDLATVHNLTTLAADPLTLAPIPNEVQDPDRLHPDWYDATDPATTPCFAWIPKIAKLPYNHNLVDGMVVTGLDINNLTLNPDSLQYLWMIGVTTLQTLNNGISFHHQTTLFDVADLQIDGNNSPAIGLRTEHIHFDPIDIVPLTNGIDDGYQTIMYSVQNAVMGAILANEIVAIPGTTNTTNNPEPVVHRTETELKNKKESDKRVELWQQLLACTRKDENGNETIYFPELNDSFKSMLGAPTVTEAMELLTKHFNNFTSTYQDILTRGILGEVTFRFGKHLSSALIRLIQTCDFNTSNINVDPEAIEYYLTPFAFLTPQEGTVHYDTTIGTSATVMREVAVGVDPSKQKRMPSKLYVGGQASTHADFVSMGANMIFLFMLALQDPLNDKPIILEKIEEQVSKTRMYGYKRTIILRSNPTSGNKYLIPHLINETCEIIAAIARVAGSSDMLTARKASDMTKIKSLYDQARHFCDMKLNALDETLASADFQRFNSMPLYYQSLSPASSSIGNPANESAASPPRKKGKHEPNNGNNNNSPTTHNNNRNNGNGGNGNRGNNNTYNPSQLGLIKPINKPANWLPKIPATITGTRQGDTATQKVCPAFILVGATCTNQSCNLLHVTNRNFKSLLNQTAQNNFIDWVTNSSDVEWTNSQWAPLRNG